MSSAVGPFAVDEGLVSVKETHHKEFDYQVNTKKRIAPSSCRKRALQRTGRLCHGWRSPHGRQDHPAFFHLELVTKALLPTGNVKDTIDVAKWEIFQSHLSDALYPVVL